jgi:hypothetical protein
VHAGILTKEVKMEYKSKEQLQQVTADYGDRPAVRPPMSQRERLEKWANLLENHGNQQLNAFGGTEFQSIAVRRSARRSGSPISVAYADPVLRREGLRNDTYGEAQRFFELSDARLHDIVCDCMSGPTVSARVAAWRVRAAIPQRSGPGLFARMWRVLAG